MSKEGFGVLMLAPEQQAEMVEDESELSSPVPRRMGTGGMPRECAWRRSHPASSKPQCGPHRAIGQRGGSFERTASKECP